MASFQSGWFLKVQVWNLSLGILSLGPWKFGSSCWPPAFPLRTPPSARWVWSRCSRDKLWDSAFQWVSLALHGPCNCIFLKHYCRSGATLLQAFLPGYPLKTRLHNTDGPRNCHFWIGILSFLFCKMKRTGKWSLSTMSSSTDSCGQVVWFSFINNKAQKVCVFKLWDF